MNEMPLEVRRGHHLFVITGCSGSGKSTLLELLADRGECVVPEPGRRVVRDEIAVGGNALPWEDRQGFMNRCASIAIREFDQYAAQPRRAFFDRSFIDVASAVTLTGLEPPPGLAAALRDRRYAPFVFVAPPWEELYSTDAERRHGFEDALAEYDVLVPTYRAHGYEPVILPRRSVEERVAFVLATIAERERSGTSG